MSDAPEHAKRVLIGLHITKCAGTSLADHVRTHMPPFRTFFCSSAWINARNSMVELPERLLPDQVMFVFGHFVHESLLGIFKDHRMFWFTGVREPIDRAISEYYQTCKVRARTGQPLLTAEQYLAERKDSLCREFIRALPTIAAATPGKPAKKAIACAKFFDLIYSTDNFATTAARLFKRLGIPEAGMAPRNLRPPDSKDSEFLLTEEEKIRAVAPEHFAEDLRLYEWLKPKLDLWEPFATSRTDRTPKARAQFRSEIISNKDCMAEFSEHLAKFYVQTFATIGRTAELKSLLKSKSDWISAMMRATEELERV